LECEECGHRFFSYRFSDAEMARLYGEYRGEKYYLARSKVEPWYRRSTNRANLDTGLIKTRKAGLSKFLEPFLQAPKRGLVIADVGGDAGQFIPLELASAAYLIEASEQTPVQGVERVASLDAVPSSVDLLICSHVLEHLPHPGFFLAGLLGSSRINPGCLIYLEVPLERYGIAAAMSSIVYRRYLVALTSLQPLLQVVDFFSVLARSYLGLVLPPLILKLHEHINYFTTQSLVECQRPLGLELVVVCQETESSLATHQGVIRLLARRL
jgi:hypothetical protein